MFLLPRSARLGGAGARNKLRGVYQNEAPRQEANATLARGKSQ
jgi:hypothetical protein